MYLSEQCSRLFWYVPKIILLLKNYLHNYKTKRLAEENTKSVNVKWY